MDRMNELIKERKACRHQEQESKREREREHGKRRERAWAFSPQIRIRSSEQTHSTDPAELVHPPYSFTARFAFLAFALLRKPSDFSVDAYFGEPPALVTCTFDVTAVASTFKADTTDRD